MVINFQSWFLLLYTSVDESVHLSPAFDGPLRSHRHEDRREHVAMRQRHGAGARASAGGVQVEDQGRPPPWGDPPSPDPSGFDGWMAVTQSR